jgi:hypothetical protein
MKLAKVEFAMIAIPLLEVLPVIQTMQQPWR